MSQYGGICYVTYEGCGDTGDPDRLPTLPATLEVEGEPVYQPLLITCGERAEGGGAHHYTVSDLERWAVGDLSECHSPPLDVIANLAHLALIFIRGDAPSPLPETLEEAVAEWPSLAGTPESPVREAIGLSVWVRLDEDGGGVAWDSGG